MKFTLASACLSALVLFRSVQGSDESDRKTLRRLKSVEPEEIQTRRALSQNTFEMSGATPTFPFQGIVGGSDAEVGEFPSFVSLYFDSIGCFGCGG